MGDSGDYVGEGARLDAFGVGTKELDEESVDGVIVVGTVDIVVVKVDVDEGGGLLGVGGYGYQRDTMNGGAYLIV